MVDLTSTFYKVLYTSKGVVNMDQLLEMVPLKVIRQMDKLLLKPFSND